MRTTIQTLTDISFDGRTIDITDEGTMTCKCNCDCLSHIAIDVYDMDRTLSPKYTDTGNGYEAIAQRGETISINMAGNRTHGNGHDYICIMTIFQAQQGASESETSPGLYNVYMGAGRIQADSETATQVNIGKNIPYIRPIRRNNNDQRIVGGCVIKLSNRMLLIESYDASTGIATVLSSSKVNGSTYSARTTNAGEPFQLITNYLQCDPFTFYLRAAPTVSLAYTIDGDGLNVTGTYSQTNGVGLQSYQLKVEYYSDVEHDGGYRLMTFEGEKKYSNVIAGTFPVLGELYDTTILSNNGMRITCEVTTQENYTKRYMLDVKAATYNQAHQITAIDFEYSTGNISSVTDGLETLYIFSVERTRNALAILYGAPHHCATAIYDDTLNKAPFNRITEGNGRYYKYFVWGADDQGNLYRGQIKQLTNEVFGNDSAAWTLRRLISDGDHRYRSSTEYEFVYDLQPGAIETNINSMVYNAESEKPKYVYGNDNYDKGTFTVILNNEGNTDIDRVKDITARYIDIADWNEFISSDGPFLLKTDKGDVKIVAITSNPARAYGAGIADFGVVKVTVGWTEIDDIDKAVFV